MSVACVNGRKTTTDHDFSTIINTNFFGDKRVKSCWYTPRPSYNLGNNPANLATSSSIIGGTCKCCFIGGRNHSVNDHARLFILGDQWIPPVVGMEGVCCPTLRVNQGDFKQLEDLVLFHISQGLRFPFGSVVCVFMSTQLLRVGAHIYWQQLTSFISWLKTAAKVTVLPGLAPYPAGLAPSHLVSISQYYHYLLGSSIRKGPVGSALALPLWKPFQMTVDELGIVPTMVPAPPVQVDNSSAIVFCEQKFAPGFNGDWSCEVPSNVQLTFLKNLFSVLSEYNLTLPQHTALHTSINNNPLQGKTLYLAGSSILQDTAVQIESLAAEKGVRILSEYKRGEFIKHMLSLNQSHLAEASSEDVLVLSFLGNYLFDKDDYKNYYSEGGANVFHLINPSIPDDTSMCKLVLDVGKIIRQLVSVFPGKIFILGPMYRHLTACCDIPEHAIRGPCGEEVDLILYTKAFSAFLHASPGIVQDKVQLIHPHEIFNTFTAESLCDGVHLQPEATSILGNFVFGLLSSKRRPRIANLTNDDFYSYLAKYKVIKTQDNCEVDRDDVEDIDADMTGAVDDIINLVQN